MMLGFQKTPSFGTDLEGDSLSLPGGLLLFSFSSSRFSDGISDLMSLSVAEEVLCYCLSVTIVCPFWCFPKLGFVFFCFVVSLCASVLFCLI